MNWPDPAINKTGMPVDTHIGPCPFHGIPPNYTHPCEDPMVRPLHVELETAFHTGHM